MPERRKKKTEPVEEKKPVKPHRSLDGALWHAPMTGDPTRCDQPGCTYVMKGRPDK